MKQFLHRTLQEIVKKNDTFNIRHLVPANQQTSILYCRFSDFRTMNRIRALWSVDNCNFNVSSFHTRPYLI